MPSLLRRLTRISFRSEMLIMNLLGLVNSTLDWVVPLKQSGELESLPLTKESFVFGIISAEQIRAILTWIVVAKLFVDNLYTCAYLSNLYTVVSWSRPLLLLPWIIFGFLKSFVLEVVIFAIGILLAFEERLPFFLVFEFVIVKVVQYSFASYTWYLNTRLYLYLKYRDKILRYRTDVRRATNGIQTIRLRSRSLTTVLSFESSSSNESTETQIFNDPYLSPMEKAMRVLDISAQDIADTKNRLHEQDDTSSTKPSSLQIGVSSKEESKHSDMAEVKTRNYETPSLYVISQDELRRELTACCSKEAVAKEETQSTNVTKEENPCTIVSSTPVREISPESSAFRYAETTSSVASKEFGKADSSPEVDRPCITIMRRREQKYCTVKMSGIGECPLGKCSTLSKNSEIDTRMKSASKEENISQFSGCYKEEVNRSEEVEAVNSTVFFDAEDQSFAKDKAKSDNELSPFGSQVKRKSCDGVEKFGEARKISKMEESLCSSPSVKCTDREKGSGSSQMSEVSKTVGETSLPNYCCQARCNDSEHEVTVESVIVAGNLAADLKSALNNTKKDYIGFMDSAIEEVRRFKSPITKPRKTYISQYRERSAYYRLPKMSAKESGNQTPPLRRLTTHSITKDHLNNVRLDPQSSISSIPTVQSNTPESSVDVLQPKQENSTGVLQLKNSTDVLQPKQENSSDLLQLKNSRDVLQPKDENSDPALGSSTLPNFKNVTVRKQTREIRSPKVQSKKNEVRRASGALSSAGRAARFKEVKALRAYNEITLVEDKRDLENRRRNLANKDSTATKRFDEEWEKENIYSDETVNGLPPIFHTRKVASQENKSSSLRDCGNTVPHKSQNLIVLNFEQVDGFLRSTTKEAAQEVEMRKPLTKFSTATEEEGESSLSAVCSKRIEGQQHGRELARIYAKEDVRTVDDPGTSASTSTESEIERPLSPLLDEKFLSYKSSKTSEDSSNLAAVDSDRNMDELREENFSENKLSTAISDEAPSSAIEACTSTKAQLNTRQITENIEEYLVGEMKGIADTAEVIGKIEISGEMKCMVEEDNDMITRLDAMKKKLDVLETVDTKKDPGEHNVLVHDQDITREVNKVEEQLENTATVENNKTESITNNEEKKEEDIEEEVSNFNDLPSEEINKPEETCAKEEHEAPKIEDSEESENVENLPTEAQNEEVCSTDLSPKDTLGTEETLKEIETSILQLVKCTIESVESIIDVKSRIPPKIPKEDASSHEENSGNFVSEEVLECIEYSNVDVLQVKKEELAFQIAKTDQPGSHKEPLPTMSSEVIATKGEENTQASLCVKLESYDVIKEETEEELREEEFTRIPQRERLSEPVHEHQRRLPFTTIILFLFLVINFYLGYFYRNIIKPTFLAIFRRPVDVPREEEVSEDQGDPLQESTDKLELSENEEITEVRSDLLLHEEQSEEAVDTEKVQTSLPEEAKLTDEELCKFPTNSQETIFVIEGISPNDFFQQYRDGQKDEDDSDKTFEKGKKDISLTPMSEFFRELGNVTDTKQSTSESQGDVELLASMFSNMSVEPRVSNSSDSAYTVSSGASNDAISLGQMSCLEEFADEQQVTPTESQV